MAVRCAFPAAPPTTPAPRKGQNKVPGPDRFRYLLGISAKPLTSSLLSRHTRPTRCRTIGLCKFRRCRREMSVLNHGLNMVSARSTLIPLCNKSWDGFLAEAIAPGLASLEAPDTICTGPFGQHAESRTMHTAHVPIHRRHILTLPPQKTAGTVSKISTAIASRNNHSMHGGNSA